MYSVFRLRRSEAQWLEDSGSILATWHVFNPNGPTVNCVGLRETAAGHEKEVFWRWMHFTGGEDYCLGYVNPEDDDWGKDLLEVLAHAFGMGAGRLLKRFALVTCVPTAVTCMLNQDWKDQVRQLFAETEAFRTADWGRERYRLEKFGPRLFERAGEEYREAYESHRASAEPGVANSEYLEMTKLLHEDRPEWKNWRPDEYVSRTVTDGDVVAWWDTATSHEYLVPVLGQMAQAWVGASHQTPGTREMTNTRFEDVRDFMAHYQHPLWPEEWTTASIAKGMRLDIGSEFGGTE